MSQIQLPSLIISGTNHPYKHADWKPFVKSARGAKLESFDGSMEKAEQFI